MATTTETQLEENLGADHPKLQAFQKAVEAALKKRLKEADEEYEFLMKENADKKESRSEHTTQLHETQRYYNICRISSYFTLESTSFAVTL